VGWTVALVVLALIVGAAVGALVARSGASDAEPTAESRPGTVPERMGHLEVVSVPPDGVVTLDGRLVGLTPLDQVELRPGKHALVIEVHGYQPYIGTVTVEAGGGASLEAHLAPWGGPTQTSGQWKGQGSQTVRAIPPTLQQAAPVQAATPAPVAAAAKTTAKKKKRTRRERPEPPRRDCSGERSRCRDKCDSAAFSCRSSCQYCGSCLTSMTWDECNRICNTCKQGCEQNEKFCESSCEHQYESCS
jgi:hypothetical protein